MENEQDIKPPEEILAYYNLGGELNRLQRGSSQLEFARTKDIILRHVPPPPAVILDVGGGTGVYSFWLAEAGYKVHLVDVTAFHIEQARATQQTIAHPLASAEVGEARHLTNLDNSIDVGLLLGPLYHLTDKADRRAALEEAYRVLKPGGILFAAVISRFASVLDGIIENRLDDPEFVQIIEADLLNGQHRNVTGKPDYFTTAYLHHPEEVVKELADAGFAEVTLLAIEGPGWLMPNFEEYWSTVAHRAQMLRFIRSLESDKSIIGASSHLMGIGHKPGLNTLTKTA